MYCKFCNREAKSNKSNSQHEIRCKLNPDKIRTDYCASNLKNRGKSNQYIKAKETGIPYIISEETRLKMSLSSIISNSKNNKVEISRKLSESMKKAHKEGRAWNIGRSRWNNEPSYPEKFFMKVIENEFIDKNYLREYPFSKYSLDFVWLHKKKVIEIDGDQHQRFPEYAARDKRKDKLLTENGYEVLRIAWKDMYNHTKEYIQKAYEFIHH